MLKHTLIKYETLLQKALVNWDNTKEGKDTAELQPVVFYEGQISVLRGIVKDLKEECPNINLQYSNPTIGWVKKQLNEAGIVFIHTNIRPDLSKVDGYEWGTCRMDRTEFERRVNIVNVLIKEANNGFGPLQDSDLLEELF